MGHKVYMLHYRLPHTRDMSRKMHCLFTVRRNDTFCSPLGRERGCPWCFSRAALNHINLTISLLVNFLDGGI